MYFFTPCAVNFSMNCAQRSRTCQSCSSAFGQADLTYFDRIVGFGADRSRHGAWVTTRRIIMVDTEARSRFGHTDTRGVLQPGLLCSDSRNLFLNRAIFFEIMWHLSAHIIWYDIIPGYHIVWYYILCSISGVTTIVYIKYHLYDIRYDIDMI